MISLSNTTYRHDWYSYAFNNPLSFTDPSGWWPENDPYENYEEPRGVAPMGGGGIYYHIPSWYQGSTDPMAGVGGWDFSGSMHTAYINTSSYRPTEAGPVYGRDVILNSSGDLVKIQTDVLGQQYNWDYVNSYYFEQNAAGVGFINHGVQSTGFKVYNPALDTENFLPSPTGLGIRNDLGGKGYWGAPRGNRLHKGIDFSSTDNQYIVAPISGKVRNFTGSTTGYPMIQLYPSNSNTGLDFMEILYASSPTGESSWTFRDVSAGDIIGITINLQGLGYPKNVGPHIHLQMWHNGARFDPTSFFFSPSY